MSDYRDALEAEAFGHLPIFKDAGRNEDQLPLEQVSEDRVYFHAQDRKIKASFRGVEQSFDSWAAGDAWLKKMKEGSI